MSDERLARQWARETLDNSAPIPSMMATQAAARHILATTTPTMADIEWDDSEHTFAGATVMLTDGQTEVVMLSESDDMFIDFALLDGRVGDEYKDRLTPNGKKYALHEVGSHPETLKDAEDYATAPAGTVVQIRGYVGISRGDRWSLSGITNIASPQEMADLGEGEVLKWGKQ